MKPRASTQRSGRPTIADVAKAAGVSKATVSRFLNHRERLLSPDIAARVEAAIAQLAYTPDPMAQALSRGRSRLIGLVVADITNTYSVAVLRGAEKACQEAGYLVMLFDLGNDIDREREAIDALAGQVDGFILHTSGRGVVQIDATTLHDKPAVLVDLRHAGTHADFVSLDNTAAIDMACGHLIDGGFSELLYVTEPLQGVSSRCERSTAFRACMAAHAPRVAGEVFECKVEDADALDAALLALRQRASHGRRVAVLTGNAVVTLWVAAAMARLGLNFGADVGLVGFDDAEWAPLIGPGLSAIAQPTNAIGRMAATCLIERLRGHEGPPRQLLLPGELVVRGSSLPG
ncbi:MAG TPA: LacI family DNA-binding transcriptional regulator [Rhodocyclaceae bacterium]|nr:LacI family DNA-binding transcriptional regulator [Rhodocyclaceae bacterium]